LDSIILPEFDRRCDGHVGASVKKSTAYISLQVEGSDLQHTGG
jgi:hypothetical protein